MKATFINKQPRILGTCTGRRLLPGKHVHDLSDNEFATIKQDQQFRSWQALGWVSLVMPQVEAPQGAAKVEAEVKEEPEDTSEALLWLRLPEAEAMISACSDPEVLLQWQDKDKRRGVKSAIEERLAQLEDKDGE